MDDITKILILVSAALGILAYHLSEHLKRTIEDHTYKRSGISYKEMNKAALLFASTTVAFALVTLFLILWHVLTRLDGSCVQIAI